MKNTRSLTILLAIFWSASLTTAVNAQTGQNTESKSGSVIDELKPFQSRIEVSLRRVQSAEKQVFQSFKKYEIIDTKEHQDALDQKLSKEFLLAGSEVVTRCEELRLSITDMTDSMELFLGVERALAKKLNAKSSAQSLQLLYDVRDTMGWAEQMLDKLPLKTADVCKEKTPAIIELIKPAISR